VSSEPVVTPLPSSYRWALAAALVLGFQVSVAAGFDVSAAINHAEPPRIDDGEAAFRGLELSPLAQRQLVLAANSGVQSAVESMLPWRTISSLLLSVAAGLVLIFAIRLRVSQERRAETAQLLGLSALGTAVLRSVDGAQNLVIMRSMMDEMIKVLVQERVPEAEVLAASGTFMVSAMSVGWTVVMVAAFMTLGNYFRSEDLRGALARAEP
jgi:hypothetical protein